MTENVKRLTIRNLGPIHYANVEFGDLTVLVGPQATGKSIFLQILKLVIDAASIRQELRSNFLHWEGNLKTFLRAYLGEGMDSLVVRRSNVAVNGEKQSLQALAAHQEDRERKERLFYIPAQRVLSMRDGITHPFSDFRFGDPFCLREFSNKLHSMVQSEFIKGTFFPQANRLKEALRNLVRDQVYGNLVLARDIKGYQKRIVLRTEGGAVLPYLVWSAGQREFTPLLLGLYWLLPPSATSRRQSLTWAVIEEPEMGLHPAAIMATMALILELLARDYKVCVSTHSPNVLDVVWALKFLKENGGTAKDVKEIFGLKGGGANAIAHSALEKEYRTYYFPRGKPVVDISSLEPGSDDAVVAGWGGLTGFSDRVVNVVGKVAERAEGAA